MLIWHCYHRLYFHSGSPGFGRWPELSEQLGEYGGLFHLLLGLAMVPMVKQVHAGLEVDEAVTRDTCMEVRGFNENHEVGRDGCPGILTEQMSWLRNYVDGNLFRVGRFEYWLKPLPMSVRAFRHRQNGTIVVLMPPATHFNQEGFVVIDPRAASWTSTLTETESGVTGYPVDPRGMVRNRPVTLLTTEWASELQPGDHVLDMHIPPGGGMTPAACRDSFTRAFEFYATTFPGRHAKAIFSASWIFNTQFEQRLPDSNLAALMREIYLFPVRSGDQDGMSFVFCRDYDDWSRAPRRTRLQRAMIDIHTSGEGLRSGGMLFFREHISRFGCCHYRNQLPVLGVFK